jgi:signal transduction histidine kinase
MQVNWLRKYISRDNKAALDLIASMRETVGTLSELSRAVEALRPDEPPPLDVNSLLYDVWEVTSASYTSKTVDVSLDLPEDVPLIRAHSPLLAEVFRTVLENSLEAIDAMDKETGHISIHSRYARESDAVEIQIEDNGAGIPPEILSRLLQCPVRSSKLSKGIGLWLARLMIVGIGGEIGIQDTKIGQGTTMRITLPAIKAADMPADGNHD